MRFINKWRKLSWLAKYWQCQWPYDRSIFNTTLHAI